MNDDRLPKVVLYSELWQAKRNVGRPHLCYVDCTKRHLHAVNINKRQWEEMAHDHSEWRTAIRKGAAKAETKRASDVEIKRQRSHELKCDMDGDFDQFEEIDDELLSSLPLSFPFESLPVEGGDGPDPKAEETKQEDKDVVVPDKFAFPFEPYEIQVDFMKCLYGTLERGKIGIFESPTGTVRQI
ncbi:hypothetical protein LSAT2_011822 [Lamellibrachia satsuma]|nr:hypothetical protein LSAT2_011822 [Lamellibrachia satsuma]